MKTVRLTAQYNHLSAEEIRDIIVKDGCSDELFNSIMNRGPEFVQKFWEQHAQIPKAFIGKEQEIYHGKFAVSEEFAEHLEIKGSAKFLKVWYFFKRVKAILLSKARRWNV